MLEPGLGTTSGLQFVTELGDRGGPIGLARRRRRIGGLERKARWGTEGERVLGDAQKALVVEPMMRAAQTQKVFRIGTAAMFPMDDVMDLEPDSGVTARDGALVLVSKEDGSA